MDQLLGQEKHVWFTHSPLILDIPETLCAGPSPEVGAGEMRASDGKYSPQDLHSGGYCLIC